MHLINNTTVTLSQLEHELRQEITRIRSNVNGLHRMLSGMKPDANCEFYSVCSVPHHSTVTFRVVVEKLKQTMETIETSIVHFKEKQREESVCQVVVRFKVHVLRNLF